MYVRGYLQGSENGRVVTIESDGCVNRRHFERTTKKAFVMSNLIGQYFVSICKLIRSREDDL